MKTYPFVLVSKFMPTIISSFKCLRIKYLFALVALEGLAKYKKVNELSLAEKPKVEYNKTISSFILYIFSMVSELKEPCSFI